LKYHGSIVRVAAPAKLNLSLRVVGMRRDGYHLLRSEFVCIDVFDSLSISVVRGEDPGVSLQVSGAPAPSGERNLAVRAALLFLKQTAARARVGIELVKRIPSGAGLGGGSSDAAAVLRALSRVVCEVGAAELAGWALTLGADVPFFLDGRPSLVEGIGERITPLSSPPRGSLVVAFGGVALATADVFRRYDASLTSEKLASSIRASATGPGGRCSASANDLEAAAIQIEPGVAKLKEALVERGGSEVAMTGSGAAVFGYWPNPGAARRAAARLRASGWWAQAVAILDEVPEIQVEGEGDDGR
jgi:4-diphosphocytidyl-2-C-methyl-D-erythritol kinase